MKAKDLQKELRKLGTAERAKASLWFFKTGPGEYGEGDIFYGVSVPAQRQLARKYKKLSLQEIEKLLNSKYHEDRLTALFILVLKYKNADTEEKEKIAVFYLKNKDFVNNWDLVDSSAPYILGDYLMERDRKIIYMLAKSPNLWDRRISVITTAWFIREEQYADTLNISEILLRDKEDLIHKAVGWMLREAGKKSMETEEKFLKKYSKEMPRTMLRYAIEKFPEEKRLKYLKK